MLVMRMVGRWFDYYSPSILSSEMFDLNTDSVVDHDDHSIWVKDLKNTWYGDASLDGEFTTADIVQVFQAGKYETQQYAGWGEGDWNGDGVFSTADFVTAFGDGCYENQGECGPRPNGVPEPSTLALFSLGVLGLVALRRHALHLPRVWNGRHGP